MTEKLIIIIYYQESPKYNNHYSKVINNIDEFKKISDVIIVNRLDDNTKDIEDKIYIRDLFVRD